jgi:hypothetical protein
MTKIKTGQIRGGLREVAVQHGLGDPDAISDELQDMINVLLNRVNAPIDPDHPTALMEIADAYYMRASELSFKIHRLERQGIVKRGDPLYKLRTGEINDFMEACKRSVETGSRRLSAVQLEFEQSKLGRSG